MVCVEGSSWDRYEPAYGDQIGLAYAEPLSSEPAFLLPSSFKKTILNLINGEPYRVQLKVEGPIRPVSTHTKQVLNKLLVGLPHYRSFFFSPKAIGQSDPLATPDLISYEVQVRSRFNDVYWIMIQNK